MSAHYWLLWAVLSTANVTVLLGSIRTLRSMKRLLDEYYPDRRRDTEGAGQ